MSSEAHLKIVEVEVPEDTKEIIAVRNTYKKWAYNHAYLLGTLAAFFILTWIVEVVVNIIWN